MLILMHAQSFHCTTDFLFPDYYPSKIRTFDIYSFYPAMMNTCDDRHLNLQSVLFKASTIPTAFTCTLSMN